MVFVFVVFFIMRFRQKTIFAFALANSWTKFMNYIMYTGARIIISLVLGTDCVRVPCTALLGFYES